MMSNESCDPGLNIVRYHYPNRDRTLHLILDALRHFSDGLHVVVIAHPAATAFEIVDRIAAAAEVLGVDCAVSEDNVLHLDSDVTMLYARPLGWSALGLRRGDELMLRVLIDQSAQHERPMTSGATRYVQPIEQRYERYERRKQTPARVDAVASRFEVREGRGGLRATNQVEV